MVKYFLLGIIYNCIPTINFRQPLYPRRQGAGFTCAGGNKKRSQLYQNQIARTLSNALGVGYGQQKAGEAIPGALNLNYSLE